MSVPTRRRYIGPPRRKSFPTATLLLLRRTGSREKWELLSLRVRRFCDLWCFFGKTCVYSSFCLVYLCVGKTFARLVTSRLDHQIWDLTVQDDLGRIHIGIGPLLPTVCTSFEPSDRKSDGHYVSGIYFSFLCVFFFKPFD